MELSREQLVRLCADSIDVFLRKIKELSRTTEPSEISTTKRLPKSEDVAEEIVSMFIEKVIDNESQKVLEKHRKAFEELAGN